MKESANEEGEEFWRTHIEGWKASGLTRQVYCQQEGISYNKFLYRLSRSRKPTKKPGIHFIEAAVQIRKEPPLLSELEVTFPNGVRIGLGGELSLSLLESILNRVGSLRC